jgi:DNA-binding transcriptional ArsR family regulator
MVKHMLDYAGTLDRTFRALADPSRRLILDRLSRGPASVGQLAAPLPMSLAAVVQHVQLLETAGLVSTKKVGRVRTCTLQGAPLRTAEKWLGEHRAVWEARLDRLDAVLRDEGDQG